MTKRRCLIYIIPLQCTFPSSELWSNSFCIQAGTQVCRKRNSVSMWGPSLTRLFLALKQSRVFCLCQGHAMALNFFSVIREDIYWALKVHEGCGDSLTDTCRLPANTCNSWMIHLESIYRETNQLAINSGRVPSVKTVGKNSLVLARI